MRVFIAIPLPQECLQALERAQKGLQSRRAEVRWASVSSIHLTLKFLGEVAPDLLPQLALSLRAAVTRARSFNLSLSELGSFPNSQNPRILWCGVGGDRDNLLHLQNIVETTCGSFGFPAEERPYSPHLTLGRVKGRKNLRSLMDCIGTVRDLECSFRADHFNIYKSVLKPQGAVYTVLDTIALIP
jgi:2'-5' RNA ligase